MSVNPLSGKVLRVQPEVICPFLTGLTSGGMLAAGCLEGKCAIYDDIIRQCGIMTIVELSHVSVGKKHLEEILPTADMEVGSDANEK